MIAAGPRLVLRADAGHRLGSGHAMRMAALAEAAIDAGGGARLLIGGEPEASVAALRRRGLDAVACGPGADGAAIAAHADEIGAEAIVLDGGHFDPAVVATLERPRRTLAAVDDRGLAPLPAAVVINPGYGAETLAARYPAASTRLLGRRHHLLRRELRALAHGGPPLAGVVRRVLITMGGSDPVGATARVVAAVPGAGLELVVVLGPGFLDHAALAAAGAAAQRRGHRFVPIDHPSALGPILADCDLAVSAAGTTLAELAYLGRPTYAIAIVDDQVEVASRQAQAGLVAGGMPLAAISDRALTRDLAALIDDPERRRALAATAAATIDGDGAARVLAALTSA